MDLKTIAALSKEAFSEFGKDNASLLAAALSYYAIFSLSPLLVLVLVAVAFLIGQGGAEVGLIGQIEEVAGIETAQGVQSIIDGLQDLRSSLFASLAGAVVLLFAASGLFLNTKRALGVMWNVRPQEGRGIVEKVKAYLLSFLMIFFIGLIAVSAIFVTAFLSSFKRHFEIFAAYDIGVVQAVNLIGSFAVVVLLLAVAYKTLSGVKLAWSDVVIGSVFTSLLISSGSLVIQLYLGRSDIGSAYGAAGSLVALLFWIYYSAQIFLFGAEFIKVYARRHGTHRAQI